MKHPAIPLRCAVERSCRRPRRFECAWAPPVAALLLAMSLGGAAQGQGSAVRAPVGTVLDVNGTVLLAGAGQAPRVAAVSDALRAGDQVLTQAGSEAVLAYADGTRVMLGANSSLQVPALEADGVGAFVTRVLRGAARFISDRRLRGAAASRFQVQAGTATIGIRGTDFVVRLCQGDCQPADDATVAGADGELAGRVAAAAGGLSALDSAGRWRVLGPDAPLREGDLVITGASGIGVLMLRDGTRIALEPDARLWIAEMRWDEERPRAGRIRLQLLDGAAQLASGRLAAARPERFELMAGGQPVRLKGTVVALKPTTPSSPGKLALPLYAVGVTQGAVQLPAAQGPSLELAAGMAAGVDESGRIQPLPPATLAGLRAPDPARVPADGALLRRFFGQAAAAGGTKADDGVYVHVRDGAVELQQGGGALLLQTGETALAPAGGAPPVKVDRGARVAGVAGNGLERVAEGAVCRPERQTLPGGQRGTRLPTAADLEVADLRDRIQGRLRPDAFQGIDTTGSIGRNRFGPEVESPQGPPGSGVPNRGPRTDGPPEGITNPNRVTGNLRGMITGWAAGSFRGETHNAGSGPPQLLGGFTGPQRDRVSAGRVSGGSVQADSGSTMYGSAEYENQMAMYGQEAETREAVDSMIADSGINTTGDRATDTAELVYFMMVGSDGYEATRNMTAAQRSAYWASQAQGQRTGSGRPRDDENFTAGGSGLPIFIGAGQYGNEIRAIERAITAVLGAAGGGKGDGRGDRQQSGGPSGRHITRGEQLGVGVGGAQASGGINWSAAFPQNIDGPRQ